MRALLEVIYSVAFSNFMVSGVHWISSGSLMLHKLSCPAQLPDFQYTTVDHVDMAESTSTVEACTL